MVHLFSNDPEVRHFGIKQGLWKGDQESHVKPPTEVQDVKPD